MIIFSFFNRVLFVEPLDLRQNIRTSHCFPFCNMFSNDDQAVLFEPDIIVSGASTGDLRDRICHLLGCDSTKKVTVAALQRLLTDTYSPSSILLRDYLLKLVMIVPMSEAQQVEVLSAKALIRHFDGVYTTETAAPVLLEAFRVVLMSHFLRPLGSLSGLASSNNAGVGGGSVPVGRRVGGVSIRCVKTVLLILLFCVFWSVGRFVQIHFLVLLFYFCVFQSRTEVKWLLDTFLAPPPVDEAPTCFTDNSGTCVAPATVESAVDATGAATVTDTDTADTTDDPETSVEADTVSAVSAPLLVTPMIAKVANTTWWKARLLPRSPSVLAQESFLEAIEWCIATYGKDMSQWKWGTAHRVQYSHPNPKVKLRCNMSSFFCFFSLVECCEEPCIKVLVYILCTFEKNDFCGTFSIINSSSSC